MIQLVQNRRLVIHMTSLVRTPASISCLEDLQSNLPPMLHDSVFAVVAAITAFITLVYMIPPFKKGIP